MGAERLKVIIVGGSIAGLTLAHCLDKAGIDYVVLEKRKEITHQEGASILILPHGGRILDQLGMFHSLSQYTEPLHAAHISYPDGFTHTNRSPQVLTDRFGIPLILVERRNLLKVLYNSLPDQSLVQLGKKVVSLNHHNGQVTVTVDDGNVYEGDLVVGADGVHSRVRDEVWRLSDAIRSGTVKDKEKKSMSIEYACIFGISNGVSGLVAGEQVASLNKGRSFLTFPGRDGRVFWFLMHKLDKNYTYPGAPRWSPEDAERIAARYIDDHIWNGVQFKDIWDKREVCGITNLEENIFQTWHSGRVLCLGDSMHKMAPNTGQGANCAMEDAALLANYLRHYLDGQKTAAKPSQEDLNTLFEKFSRDRINRLQSIYKMSRIVVRLHAGRNLFLRLMGRYYLPNTGDVPANQASKSIASGIYLDYLPLPTYSAPGWQDFAPNSKLFSGSLLLIMSVALLFGVICWAGRDIHPLSMKILALLGNYVSQ
uniref:FAD-dependent monooxygenase esdpE n=1 Tax=Penicillium shearii TaxID=904690 RepID=ESDPE_PENSH|nr:flavin-containing monooxygenase [Penicillium shearii]